jgi:exosome complex RNA-binding protein Rrp4
LKYGKLENGQIVIVPAYLMKRLPQHYVSLPCGMDIIFGKNGFIWITRTVPEEWKRQAGNVDDITPLAETLQNLKIRHCKTPLTKEERFVASRLHNAINLLAKNGVQISPETVFNVFQKSQELKLEVKVSVLACVSYFSSLVNGFYSFRKCFTKIG